MSEEEKQSSNQSAAASATITGPILAHRMAIHHWVYVINFCTGYLGGRFLALLSGDGVGGMNLR